MIEDVFTLQVPFRGAYRLQRLRFGQGSPRLAVVAGLHGNELNGIHALNLLARSLQAQAPRGTVDLFPIPNAFGIEQGRKRGPFEEVDLNTVFPGDPGGTAIQRVAAALLEATDAQVGVDLHSGSLLVHELPQVRLPMSGAELELGRAMGLPFVWRRAPRPADRNSLVGCWRAQGRPALRVMGGRGATLDMPESLAMAKGLLRLMAQLGMVSAPRPGSILADVTHREITVHRCRTGGFFVPEVAVGAQVRSGHLLGRVVAPVGGATLEDVRADRDGIVTALRLYPMVHAQELLLRVAAPLD